MRKNPWFSDWILTKKSGTDSTALLAEYVAAGRPLPKNDDRKVLREVLRKQYMAPLNVLKAFDTAWRVFRS